MNNLYPLPSAATYDSEGSDNTSINLILAVYFITTEPKYLYLLRDELEQAFPDPSGPLPDDKLVRVPLLDAVLNEALRLGSPYFLPRVVPEGGATIDGQFIPEGTVVAQAAYSQQVDPENFYPDPLVSSSFVTSALVLTAAGVAEFPP